MVTYETLKDKIGTLDNPIPPDAYDMHFCIVMFSLQNIQQFSDVMDTLDKRGAVRRRDYAICGYGSVDDPPLTLVLHTKQSWLSTEDIAIPFDEVWS